MKYMCRDCFQRFSEHYVFWIHISGEYICDDCFRKDVKLRRKMDIPARVVTPAIICTGHEIMDCYILEGTKFRKAKSMEEWGKYIQVGQTQPTHRHVALDRFYVNNSEYCSLSTVFLGIDHNFGLGDGPVLFESMIFGGDSLDETMQRYRTWKSALIGHRVLCVKIDQRIRSRHKVSSLTNLKEEGKLTENYYTLKVEGFIAFNKEDLRLIRED